MEKGAPWATVHGVAESDVHELLSTHALQRAPSRGLHQHALLRGTEDISLLPPGLLTGTMLEAESVCRPKTKALVDGDSQAPGALATCSSRNRIPQTSRTVLSEVWRPGA